MREGWAEVPLGDLISVVRTTVQLRAGVSYPAAGVMMEGRGLIDREPFIGGESGYKKLTPIVPGQLVLRSITAWEAPITVVPDGFIGRHVSGVFPVFEIDSRRLLPGYMRIVCQWPEFWNQMRTRAIGTVLRRKTLNARQLMEIRILLPSTAEQRRIVDLVSAVDEYIAALQRQADAARTARNAVLHALLTSGGDDWVETTLGEVITLEYGKPLRAESRDGKGFPVFGSAGEVGYHSDPLVDQAPVIIVGRKGTAGAVWWSDVPCSVIDTAYYAVPKCDSDLRFLYFILEFLNLPSLNAQTGVPGLNRDRAHSVQVLMPPLETQRRIVEIVSSVDDLIHATETAINESKALRYGLLSDLLSGEHEIPASYDRLLSAA